MMIYEIKKPHASGSEGDMEFIQSIQMAETGWLVGQTPETKSP